MVVMTAVMTAMKKSEEGRMWVMIRACVGYYVLRTLFRMNRIFPPRAQKRTHPHINLHLEIFASFKFGTAIENIPALPVLTRYT